MAVNDALRIELDGLKETRDSLLATARGLSAQGGLRGVVAKGTLRAHGYVSKIVHVAIGRLKNSLFPTVEGSGNNVFGVIGTNVVYAPFEHDRGGAHAFFERTVNEEGPAIVQMMENDLFKGLA